MSDFLKSLKELVFPSRCICCGRLADDKHLCSGCAEEQGLLRAFDYDPFESLLEDFFSPRFSLGGTMLRTLPRFRTAAAKPAVKSAEADPALAKRREKEALRYQLEEAVKEENYEKAIELRDKLRSMDKE